MSLLGKLAQLDRAVVAQINPFDHGATFQTVTQHPQLQQYAPAPIQQVNINRLPSEDAATGNVMGVRPGQSLYTIGASPTYFDPSGSRTPQYSADMYPVLPIHSNRQPLPYMQRIQ